MGLECQSDTSVMALGSFFFIGVLFSIFIWIKTTDKLGRKPIIFRGALMQLIAYTGVIFFQPSLIVMYFFYFLLGIGTVLSMCTSYNILIEFTPREHKIVVGTMYLSL
jgi:MFS family permease